jgi:hypothetical protein
MINRCVRATLCDCAKVAGDGGRSNDEKSRLTWMTTT